MRTALTIAGSDPVSGAGLQADIKAMNSLGVHCASVVTAVTAQNTCEVRSVFPMSPEAVNDQLDSVLGDLDVRAAKTGMLYSREIVRTVADMAEDFDFPLVVDPVMVATVGQDLAERDYAEAVKRYLLPMASIVTPNRREAEILSGIGIRSGDDAAYACEVIGKYGQSVLLKSGTSDRGQITDYLYLSSGISTIVNPRFREDSGHGSGCVLSAYITANLANGLDLVASVREARRMIQRSITTQYRIGRGVPVVNPNISLMRKDDRDRVSVLRDLDSASAKLSRFMPLDLVPEEGINIAYAVKNAKGPEDIAGIEGRITAKAGGLVPGKARFGAGGHLSSIIAEMMGIIPKVRCTAYFRGDGYIVGDLRHAGFCVRVSEADVTDDDAPSAVMAAAGGDGVPDQVVLGRKDMRVYVFGKGPREVVSKIDRSVRRDAGIFSYTRPSARQGPP